MAREYKEEIARKTELKIEALLKTAPAYINDFYRDMQHGKREISTLLNYISHVIDFIKYEMEMLAAQFDGTELKDFPVDVFDSLNTRDINEYRAFLHNVRMVTNSSMKSRFSALSVFYQFLNRNDYTKNNPMQDFEMPAVNKHRIIKLDADLSGQLCEGVLANDRYLIEDPDGESRVVDIPEDIRARRDKLVLRNYAIIRTFLGTGLRCSELVGLDLHDINFRRGCFTVITKGGDENEVYFGLEVEEALHSYLDPYSKRGRSALQPKKNCDAVFITTRGSRMTVRAVELMIKEMVKTYLPDYDDKDIFSPHKLRATCATRILTQTGNVALASQQLNHKGVAVTAAFYAELQKENQKAQIQKLSVDKW